MKNRLNAIIENNLRGPFSELGVSSLTGIIELQETPDSSKGDFALNSAMKLAKTLKQPPIKIASKVAESLSREKEWFREVVVAPPGFVNIFLSENAIEKILIEITTDLNKALRTESEPIKVIVDYSSVNIAKQMHVGHLRSTIIGDVISRVLEARGETVIRQNHLGDWGLPMAMVLWKARPVLREIENRKGNLEKELTLTDLENIYRDAAKACKDDLSATKTCQEILVRLQSGDRELLEDWKKIVRLSMDEVYRIYQLLGVQLTDEHERGESFYRDQLSGTVEAIKASGKLVESQGAKCVFLEHFKAKDGSPLPVIVQKSDGGFNYETFDLAGIRFRIEKLRASRLIYVTDARQALHFAQVFDVAAVCGLTGSGKGMISLEHVPFGSVLGEDNKPLKTRGGENIKLSELLNEAIERAYAVVKEKNPALAEDKKRSVARAVGIGAVKYADLAQNRNNDYVFSWEKMLAFNGNTAPYLQYAHARICSIFRKGGFEEENIKCFPKLAHPVERALAMKLVRFPEMVAAVERELRPHILCNFLFDLATAFSVFFDQCPVLAAETEEIRQNRLALCGMVRRTLEYGLDLLGIESPREM